MKRRKTTAGVAALLALTLAPAAAMGGKKETLDPSLCDPGQHAFTTDVNNGFFPLPVTGRWDLAGEESHEDIALRITITGTEKVGTVDTLVVEEAEGVDLNEDGKFEQLDGDRPIEVAKNYFAQTVDGGTVCYFGEYVVNYDENGQPTDDHTGSWRADEPNSAPGIFMPAEPRVGMKFAQENAPTANDQATIADSGFVFKTPAGKFKDTLRINELNPFDGSRSVKVYARGVGLIGDDTLKLTGSTLRH